MQSLVQRVYMAFIASIPCRPLEIGNNNYVCVCVCACECACVRARARARGRGRGRGRARARVCLLPRNTTLLHN